MMAEEYSIPLSRYLDLRKMVFLGDFCCCEQLLKKNIEKIGLFEDHIYVKCSDGSEYKIIPYSG